MVMQRSDPFNEMTPLRQAMGQLLAESFIRPGTGPAAGTPSVPLDILEHGDALVVRASLPGVTPDDIDINVQQNVLTIAGQVREERSSDEGHYHLAERRTGRFARSVSLPVPVNAEDAEATFEHGVLTLTLPKAEQARTRRIPIRGVQQPEQLATGQTTNGAQAKATVGGRS